MTMSADARLLDLVGEIQGLLDLDEFRHGLLDGLVRAVPAEWVSINDIGPRPDEVVFLTEPELPPGMGAVFARLAHENPLIERFQRTRDGRAYRFSDVVTTAQRHALAIHREFYGPLDIEHQIAFVLRTEPDTFLGVALCRSERDFADEERDLLDRARPFIIQGYRNALAHTRVVRRLTGSSASPEAALAAALRGTGLTARESTVVSLVALGRAGGEIATALEVSERTVHKHLENAYRKLEVTSRSQAAGAAWRLLESGSTQ
jgi:DNA-binding CsgD family transcriptional regulator